MAYSSLELTIYLHANFETPNMPACFSFLSDSITGCATTPSSTLDLLDPTFSSVSFPN